MKHVDFFPNAQSHRVFKSESTQINQLALEYVSVLESVLINVSKYLAQLGVWNHFESITERFLAPASNLGCYNIQNISLILLCQVPGLDFSIKSLSTKWDDLLGSSLDIDPAHLSISTVRPHNRFPFKVLIKWQLENLLLVLRLAVKSSVNVFSVLHQEIDHGSLESLTLGDVLSRLIVLASLVNLNPHISVCQDGLTNQTLDIVICLSRNTRSDLHLVVESRLLTFLIPNVAMHARLVQKLIRSNMQLPFC